MRQYFTMIHRNEQIPEIDLHLATAEGFLQLGQALEANGMLERIDADSRSLSEVLHRRLRVYIALKRWEPAAEVAHELWRRDPSNVEWYYAWGKAVAHFDPTDESASALRDMLRSGIVDYAAALEASEEGDMEDAVNHLQLALEFNPGLRRKVVHEPRLKMAWVRANERKDVSKR